MRIENAMIFYGMLEYIESVDQIPILKQISGQNLKHIETTPIHDIRIAQKIV